ncbi:MAG TPA: universal stress protein [Longimicrobium sp.]|nr:universal stress protein [Longimicrobium sp.]
MDARIRDIVVGVAALGADDPATAPAGEDPVLAPAVELAARAGATLHVAHAFELPDSVLAAYGMQVPYVDPGLRDRCARDLEERLARLVARFEGARIRCHVVEGSAGRALVDLAARLHAGLVVVGATRRGRVWRNLLGTTAERVVRTSEVPVLVMHQPFARPVRRLLLAADLSPECAGLLRRGVAAARALFGPALEMRGVVAVGFDPMVPPPPLDPASLREAAAAELRRFLAPVTGGARAGAAVRFGEPPREIVTEAEEWGADLVVMGTHGRSGFARFLLGSTAAATLRGAACNVLVVPGAPARRPAAAPAPEAAPDRAGALVLA